MKGVELLQHVDQAAKVLDWSELWLFNSLTKLRTQAADEWAAQFLDSGANEKNQIQTEPLQPHTIFTNVLTSKGKHLGSPQHNPFLHTK